MKRKSKMEDAWKKGIKRLCRERWEGKTSGIGREEGCGYKVVCRERWGG
jgi:hypothetical protein